jgi:hypothetical protein
VNPHFAPCFTADLCKQNAKNIAFNCKRFGGKMEEGEFYETPEAIYHNFNLAQDRSAKPH